MSPSQAVQHQLDAYNARDLERFLAVYDDEVKVYRPPAPEAAMVGKAAVGEFHASQRFHLKGLHAELLGRISAGNRVIDHERVSGIRDEPFEVVVVYEVTAGKIAGVWFFPVS